MATQKRTLLAGALMLALLLAIACGGSGEETAATAPASAPAVAPAAASAPAPAPASAPTQPSEGKVAALVEGKVDACGRIVIAGVAYGGIINGCGGEPKYGGIAIFATRNDLQTTDPTIGGGITTDQVVASMYGRGNLIRPKRVNNFEQDSFLATSWDVSADFKVWTFKLRSDVKWHDGVSFNADDVVYWINFGIKPPKGRSTATWAETYRFLDKVEALDPLTVRFTFKEPQPYWTEQAFRTYMSHPKRLVQPLIDKGEVKVQPNDYGWVAVGPFKILRYDKGSVIRVRRFDQYFEKDAKGRQLPYMDGIDFIIMRDRGAMVSAFRAGRLDGSTRGTGQHILPQQEEAIKRDLGDKVWFGRILYLAWGGGPNALKPPWDDLRLRKAVTLFMDRVAVQKLVWGGNGAMAAIWPPGSPFANADLPQWPGWNPATKAQDQAEARRLLKEAGLEGLKTTILCRDQYIEMCEGLDGVLRGMGLQPAIEMSESNAIRDRKLVLNFEIEITSAGSPLVPGEVINSWLTTNKFSTFKHGESKIDAYMDNLATSLDPVARQKVAQEFERYVILEKAYSITYGREVAVLAYRSHIKGMPIPHAMVHDNTDYATTWIDK